MKVLFLYTQLAGYFSNCIEFLYKTHGADIKVIYYPQHASAPFKFELTGVSMMSKNAFLGNQLEEHCLSFAPDLVYVAGWVDKDYKKIARRLKERGTIVVSGLDNVWKGTLRQRLACIFSNALIKPYFTYLWVAGHRQYQFARRLGYSKEYILTGLYSADVEKFMKVSRHALQRRLIYVGRFEKVKGIEALYDVFSSLTADERKGWTLDIIGNGTLRELMLSTATIRIHAFMQPNDLIQFVADAGGFILPSIDEPWGVVTQEFAAAGKPLLLSSEVNSGEEYLIHGYNGYIFKSGDNKDLKAKLIKFFTLDDETRRAMGNRSVELARRGEPKYWAAKLLSLVPNQN